MAYVIMHFSLLVAVSFGVARAQQYAIHAQPNTFNSSFTLSASHRQLYNLSTLLSKNVEVALNYERSNWALGSIDDDGFYDAPSVTNSTPAGTLLRVEEVTDTSYYTIAPNLAMSRILYVTETLNGSMVPASAYVLWPWHAKSFSDSSLNVSGVPVVAWAHGTSGVYGECAPSHIRNLWYQFSAPYILALQGYAVVAPDYAGLGVNQTLEGDDVIHQYMAGPAHANDLFYAVEAARKAFSDLSKQFVVMGHSQGGLAAWSAAERQARKPVEGYLGAIAASPTTDIMQIFQAAPAAQIALAWRIGQGLSTIFPDFQLSEWLTGEGVRRVELMKELGGCNSVETQLFPPVKADLSRNQYFQRFSEVTSAGRKPISGPMLVMQGEDDPVVDAGVTASTVNDTCSAYSDSQIQYASFGGATHVPVLNAGQQLWLKFIEERFMGIDVGKGCSTTTFSPLRPLDAYQKDLEHYLQLAMEWYTVA
ncbi:Alpha/Beta hydrolase protein [Lophiotrema nucula]|uniref:Alpha/Beta hydrolase protein n=1 Tax=Lophiotrema nucula TaxID=690887 RepID=A0A6A5ZED4_9PLEO|nr:Alpha/Beta hydrolase protein [Lophiotrema nucula]